MDRRRSAGLLAVVLAGSATIATSQPAPTPAATLKQSLEGRLELSRDAPMAVQEFHLRLNGPSVSTVTWELEILVGLIDPDSGIKIVDVTPTPSPP